MKNYKYVPNQCVQSIKKQKGYFKFEGQMWPHFLLNQRGKAQEVNFCQHI